MKKVIVAGTRYFTDYGILKKELDSILKPYIPDVTIISGTARGADRLGERYANENGLVLVKVSAEWNKYGKKAGMIRNREMAEMADMLVAFWDGQSKGTNHMIDMAMDKGLEIHVVYI